MPNGGDGKGIGNGIGSDIGFSTGSGTNGDFTIDFISGASGISTFADENCALAYEAVLAGGVIRPAQGSFCCAEALRLKMLSILIPFSIFYYKS